MKQERKVRERDTLVSTSQLTQNLRDQKTGIVKFVAIFYSLTNSIILPAWAAAAA